jgi:FkbM family methyltransferase
LSLQAFNLVPRKALALSKRSVKFARRLGVWKGPYTLAATVLGRRQISIRLAGVQRPLVIRPRTTDRFVFEQIFLDGEYDLPDCIRPAFIVDAGANVGFASILFANRYPDAMIVALEPEADNYRALVRNTSEYPQILPMRAALWSKAEPLFLDATEDSWSCRVRTPLKGEAGGVSGIAMQELLKIHGQSSIDILKMDIEGAEREVFNSDCHSWLSRTGTLVIELHDHLTPGCSQALDVALAGLPFHRSKRGENTILINHSRLTQPREAAALG